MKTVYVAMSVDLLHKGHINILNKARELGEVTVGLLTDQAIVSYKRAPYLDFEHRKIIIQNIKGVSHVIPQETLDYRPNLLKLKPDFVVHGDDWTVGIQKQIREQIITTLTQWSGTLVEVPYTQDISSTMLNKMVKRNGITPTNRIKSLKRLLEIKQFIRVIGAYNGLTGLLVNNTQVLTDSVCKEFDAIWSSSLSDSLCRGKPDIEVVDFSSRCISLNDIIEVTTKPIIFDGDTGGSSEHFAFTVKTLERLGVSAIIVEDKKGLKQNSLFSNTTCQEQEETQIFSNKITIGKHAQNTEDFMVIARIESFILNKGLDDAFERAASYIQAGADGIMIHSKEKTPNEIFSFCDRFKKIEYEVPLVVVPTTYDSVLEDELVDAGVNIIIYANQLIRTAYCQMVKTAKSILLHGRSEQLKKEMSPIQEILSLV